MYKEKRIRLAKSMLWAIPLFVLAILMPLIFEVEAVEAGWGDVSWLTVYVSPSRGGHVNQDGIRPSSYPYVQYFPPGTDVSLEAVPSLGYRFDNWSGDVILKDRIIRITLDSDKRVTANYSRIVPNWLVAIIIVSITIALIFIWRRRRLKYVTQTNPQDNGALSGYH